MLSGMQCRPGSLSLTVNRVVHERVSEWSLGQGSSGEVCSFVLLCFSFLGEVLQLMTFDQIRPLRVLAADHFFVASLLLLLWSEDRRLLKSRGSGVLAAVAVILCGTLLSGVNAISVQIFVLFGLFAPLAIAHAKDVRKNMLFLVGGIFVSCATAIPCGLGYGTGVEDALAIKTPYG